MTGGYLWVKLMIIYRKKCVMLQGMDRWMKWFKRPAPFYYGNIIPLFVIMRNNIRIFCQFKENIFSYLIPSLLIVTFINMLQTHKRPRLYKRGRLSNHVIHLKLHNFRFVCKWWKSCCCILKIKYLGVTIICGIHLL